MCPIVVSTMGTASLLNVYTCEAISLNSFWPEDHVDLYESMTSSTGKRALSIRNQDDAELDLG